MRQRCTNPGCPDYFAYGGRGITHPPKWETYAGFFEDMGKCPDGHTLHRKDNALPYSKENCEWATGRVQRLVQTREPGSSGLFGIYWNETRQKWISRTTQREHDIVLYYGPDFFEACCARLSWESRRSHNSLRKIVEPSE